jgi:hypothetical protein
MNAALLRARGMGLDLPSPSQITIDPAYSFPNIFGGATTPPFNPSSSSAVGGLSTTQMVLALVNKGLDTFMATKLVNAGQFNNAYRNPQYAQYYAQGQGVGFGIDSSGIRLSDGSHISWILIFGGFLAWKLIQSPGFEKRR